MRPVTVKYDFTPIFGAQKSKQFSPEDLRNVYAIRSESNNRIAISSFPGLKPFSTGAGRDRGSHVMSGVHYVINGTTLYSEDSFGARTSIGSIPGTGRAIFADDGSTLAIAADGFLYQYNGSVSTITTSVSVPEWVEFTNKTWVVGYGSVFAVSNTDDITKWNALNVAEAEAVGDSLVRGYLFKDLLYMLGQRSTEVWYYSGQGNPPFDRRNTSLIDTGVIGKYAVGSTDQFMYIVSDDRRVFQITGASARSINTSAVSRIINSYTTASDCVVSTFDHKGQIFVMFKFPSAGDCLIYSESSDYWIPLSSGTDKYHRESWYGSAVIRCYEKNLVVDYRNGNTYELDEDTYTDNGDTRLCFVTGTPITGAAIGLPQNRITFSSMMIPMQTGVGLATGQGVDPVLMCDLSPSGGEIWDAQEHVSTGVMGEYNRKVMFYDFVTGYEIVPRVMWSDPVPVTIYSGGTVDLLDGGY